MKKVTQRLFLFACMLSLLVLAACNNSSETTSSKNGESGKSSSGGKTMYLGITNPPGTINPINAKDLSAQIVSSILFDSLFDIDSEFNFIPKVAQSMETKDNMNFVIKLNPDAKWTDGEPFTTDDIAFTLKLMANPKVTSIGLQALSIIEGLEDNGTIKEGETDISGIKIVDAQTLNVQTKVPVDINFLQEKLGVDIRFLPEHVLKDVDPEKLHQDPFMQKPTVTSGPFTLAKFSKDQYVEFAANKDYYRGAPKLDKLFFKVMPSANLVAQLQTGEIHMNVPSVGPLAVEDFEKVKNMSNVEFIQGKPLDAQKLFVNLKTISDKKARQALVYAINREQVVDKLYKGEAEVSEGPYTSANPYSSDVSKKYTYDPKKAKELLKEANWDFNQTINFAVPAGNKTREQSATIIAENLQAVGVKVQINKYDLPTILQKGSKQDFDILMLGIPFVLDPDKSQFYQTGGPYNFAGYSNPKFDELIEKGKNEPNPEKRQVIYNQSVEILQEDLPTFTLYVVKSPGVVSKKVKVGRPSEVGMFSNVNEWDIEE